MTDTPVVVVGAGMSGCAVAAELARHGVPVTLVEAGPDADRRHVAASPGSAAWQDPAADPYFVPFRPGVHGGPYGGRSGLRRRVGGRSLYWRGIVLRLEPYALADWPVPVREALAVYYDRVEAELVAWCGRRLDAARDDREARFVETVRARGYPAATATPRAVRVLPDGAWAAYSPVVELPAEVTVLAGRPVTGLSLTAGGDVTMSFACGEPLRARAAVLCAGTVDSARLAALLAAAEQAPVPGGFRIVDHHVRGWVAASDPAPRPVDASVLALRDAAARSNLVVEQSTMDGTTLLDAWAMGEQLLTDAARFTVDGPRFDVRATRADHEVLDGQGKLLDELAGAFGAARAEGPDVDFDGAVARAVAAPGRAFPYHCRLGSLDHESGSLPLAGELVDAAGRLRGLGPVYVAGPAAFPRAGAANPGLTTLAVSRYVAGRLLAAL